MVHDVTPMPGDWFEHTDKGQRFTVIDVDEERSRIEVQYFDGDIDEFDMDDWYALEILPIDSPEDWTGPIDSIEPDELDYAETGGQSQEWQVPEDSERRSKTGQEFELPRDTGKDNRAEGSPDEEEPKGGDL